jgi:hypothetical protein
MSSIFLPLIFLPIRLLIPVVGNEGRKMGGHENEKARVAVNFEGMRLGTAS